MTQTTLLIVLAAILTGGVLLYNTQRHALSADERLEEQQYKGLARDAADVGLNLVVRRLADSFTMGSWTDGGFDIGATAYDGGTFTADVQRHNGSGDTVNVVVRGWSGGAGRAAIFARYARAEDDLGVPPAFRNVITTELDIRVDGRLLVDAIDDDYNASVHSNDILLTNGSSYYVEGYGTYYNDGVPRTYTPNELARFQPNIDYNGSGANIFAVDDPIDIPTLDAAALQSAAASSGAVRNGTLTVTGATIDFTNPSAPFWSSSGLTYTCASPPCGTEENPFVLYVSGALTFSGTNTVTGYGVIYSHTSVTASGRLYGSINGDAQTQLLVATRNDITIANNTCLGLGPRQYRTGGTWNNNTCQSASNGNAGYTHGLSLYAEGAVDFSGNPFIVGGIVSPVARFNGNGNPWIAYAAPTESIIDPGFEYVVPIGPILTAYSEW